jgi:hypothetical protein
MMKIVLQIGTRHLLIEVHLSANYRAGRWNTIFFDGHISKGWLLGLEKALLCCKIDKRLFKKLTSQRGREQICKDKVFVAVALVVLGFELRTRFLLLFW